MPARIRYIVLVILAMLSGFSSAEKKPIHIAKDVSLTVEVILDSTITEGGAQLVLNPSMAGALSDVESLPDYCLLNATASLENGSFTLTPGAMVCVSQDIRILEAVVSGRIVGLPDCKGCTSVNLMSGDRFDLELDRDLDLQLQIRADGQAQ